MLKYFFLLFLSLQFAANLFASEAKNLSEKGWAEKVKDNNVAALKYFGLAYETAIKENNTLETADALLNLGICYYGISYTQGLDYSIRAMTEYKKLEKNSPQISLQGRSKCLQLISTINSRQGKFKEAISLSNEALKGFSITNDTTSYVGLIYTSLGSAYKNLGNKDSAEIYFQKALTERIRTKNFTYLPISYINVAELEMSKGNSTKSKLFFDKAFAIADSTGNRESKVNALLGLGKWFLLFEKNNAKAEEEFISAKKIAVELADKIFYLKTLEQLTNLKNKTQDFKVALIYKNEIAVLKDSMNVWENQKLQKSLEVQFDVSEKDRLLKIASQEKEISKLTITLLAALILFLLLITIGIILFLRRINNRDKQLLITKEELLKTTEEKKLLQKIKLETEIEFKQKQLQANEIQIKQQEELIKTKEELINTVEEKKQLQAKQLQNEIEFKESQLSAISLQMLQKNELLQELKEKMEEDKTISKDNSINKIINKGLNQEKDWSDFNSHFESINKNFYTRIKQAFPDVSPNELKICALIKMNLSIKEMASILNISPDSVKTARYRLRKKLQLNTEDNLTDFILSLN
jgi:tetratricopeptide (TPR) repeat protein